MIDTQRLFLVGSLSALMWGCAELALANDNCENDDCGAGSDDLMFFDGDILLGDGDETTLTEDVRSFEQKLLFGGNRKFIYQQDLAYVLSDPEDVASNRASLRFQWNRVFSEHYFLLIDLKPIVYLYDDDAIVDEDDNFDTSFNTKELYLKFSYNNTALTFGRKIVIWGESDSTAVTDVISPQNITELVFTSLDESRLAQTMFTIDQYMGRHLFSVVVNPDIKFDELPVGAEAADIPTSYLGKKEDDLNTELGLRWKMNIGNGDFALMAADLLDNGSTIKWQIENGAVTGYSDFYQNYQMLGASANLNLGKTALKIESAYNIGRAQSVEFESASNFANGYDEGDELILSAVLDYDENGLRSWTFGYLYTQLLEYENFYQAEESNVTEVSFGVSDKYLNELLSVSADYQYELETKSSITNVSLNYSYMDNLDLRLDLFSLKNLGGGNFDQDSIIARVIYIF